MKNKNFGLRLFGLRLFLLFSFVCLGKSDVPDFRVDTLENCAPSDIHWHLSKKGSELVIAWVTETAADKLTPVPTGWPHAEVKKCTSSSSDLLCRHSTMSAPILRSNPFILYVSHEYHQDKQKNSTFHTVSLNQEVMVEALQIECSVGSRTHGWSKLFMMLDNRNKTHLQPKTDKEGFPKHVHIAIGSTPDRMTVTWSTLVPACRKVCLSSQGSKQSCNTVGESSIFIDGGSEKRKSYVHSVELDSLKISTLYSYNVGCEEFGISGPFTFTTMPDSNTLSSSLPHKFIVLGDIGYTNAPTLPEITKECFNPMSCLAVVSLGDYGYDMDTNQGRVGDAFMNELESLAAYTPFMAAMGNHEAAYNFTHYTERFRGMPKNPKYPTVTIANGDGNKKSMPNNWFYSYNIGLVHFAVISTEIYYFQTPNHPSIIENQLNWLKEDLEMANKNRTLAPWLIVVGHRPLYCSNPDCDKNNADQRKLMFLDGLFYEYGVDLYLAGHQHNYERMFDIFNDATEKKTTNMKATTYIVNGAGGQNEYPWQRAAFHDELLPSHTENRYVTFRNDTYGYSRMYVYNRTHLHWQQIQCDPLNPQSFGKMGVLIDDAWIIQTKHAPFLNSHNNVYEDSRLLIRPIFWVGTSFLLFLIVACCLYRNELFKQHSLYNNSSSDLHDDVSFDSLCSFDNDVTKLEIVSNIDSSSQESLYKF